MCMVSYDAGLSEAGVGPDAVLTREDIKGGQ
jgi:hypothetical protein